MEINFSTLFWTIINFLILLVALKFILFKPLLASLRQRSQGIHDSLSQAQEARRQLELLRADQAKQLEGVKAEAQAVRASVAKAAEEDRARVVAEAHDEATKVMTRAQAQIQQDTESAIVAIRGEMASIAIAAASKVIGRNLSGDDQERLVDDFLKEVAT